MRKIGIICAGDEELEPFLRRMGKTAVSQKAMLSFHEGRAAGFSAAALFCGGSFPRRLFSAASAK